MVEVASDKLNNAKFQPVIEDPLRSNKWPFSSFQVQ